MYLPGRICPAPERGGKCSTHCTAKQKPRRIWTANTPNTQPNVNPTTSARNHNNWQSAAFPYRMPREMVLLVVDVPDFGANTRLMNGKFIYG